MTKGEQIRDFIKKVEDVAKELVQGLKFDKMNYGDIIVKNIGSGKPVMLRQFAEFWWKKFGAVGKIHFGSKDYRNNEIMRITPLIDKNI